MFQDYRSRIARFLLVTLLFSVIPATSSTAAQTMTACVTKKTGAMRLLTKGTCKKTEKKMTWNVQGEQGIPGVAGTAGPVGPAGATGPAGAAGTNGAAGVSGKDGIDGKSGNTILYGTTNPTASIGVAGDFYINTATSTLFGPKTSTWPTGTSLVGPTGAGAAGPAGPAGAQGPAGTPGASGASNTVLWMTPQELLASRNSIVSHTGQTDTSTVVSLNLNSNGNHIEVLDLAQGQERVIFKPAPKGWSDAQSITMKIYWMTAVSTSQNVSFDIYSDSRSPQDLLTSTADWRGNTYRQVSSGAYAINVVTVNFSSSSVSISEDDLIMLSLYRYPITMFTNINDYRDDFAGKVYLIGVSIQANF